MSRHTHSHSSRSSGSKKREEERIMEDTIAAVKDQVQDIDEMLSDYPDEWEDYLSIARSATHSLDRIHLFRHERRLNEQLWMLRILQDFAFQDADNGPIKNVADWVQSKWLRILRDHPNDEDILAGLGRHWYLRAQPSLATIQKDESSGYSGGNSGSESASRLQSSTYVEARGFLQPSVDFYARAVSAAERADGPTGDLLANAAESYMSLGNVTVPPSNEQLFARAVRLLRRARDIQGYSLNTFHQQYLEEYGRYVS